jgi:UTP--glucose-1-phosphate uridylyltransferase
MKLTKAIIPVAGYGTRRLPISKALEKCMMPVLNRPIVDYIVQDCIAAGIRDFYFVVNAGATQIKNFYSEDLTLEAYLKRNHKESMLPLIEPLKDCTVHFVEQPVDRDYGTTVPVWLCREFIEPDEHVLVIMGDQFFFNKDGQSEAAHFIKAAQNAGTPAAMLAVEVPHHDVSKYGIVSLHTEGENEIYDSIIEKPSAEEAPTNLNNGSFYLFDHKFFSLLDAGMQKLSAGEHMIIDVLNEYAATGSKIAVIRNRGEYLDCGNVDGWLYANTTLAKYANK